MNFAAGVDANAASRLSPEGELTIYRAAELKPLFMQSLETDAPLLVDLSRVTEFDTAGLQLLILLKREAMQRGVPMNIVSHSATVIDLLQLFDLVSFFGDPLVIPQNEFFRGANS